MLNFQTKKQRTAKKAAAAAQMWAALATCKAELSGRQWNDRQRTVIANFLYAFDLKVTEPNMKSFAGWIDSTNAWRDAFDHLFKKYRFADGRRSLNDKKNDFYTISQMFSNFENYGKVKQADMEKFRQIIIREYNRVNAEKIQNVFNYSVNFNIKNPFILGNIEKVVDEWVRHQNNMYAEATRVVNEALYNGIHPYTAARPRESSYFDVLTGNVDTELSEKLGKNMTRSKLGKMFMDRAQFRIDAFARTEATNLLNMSNRDHLQNNGDVYDGKKWQSALSETTRKNHADMDGVAVGINELYDFTGIDGFPYNPPYPCHFDLPVGDRVNCECWEEGTVIGIPEKESIWRG